MKMRLRSGYDPLSLRRTKAGIAWCLKPAKESGLDIAPNPQWSPRICESTRSILCHTFDVHRRRGRGDDHGEHFPLLCWFGRPQGFGRSLCTTNRTKRPLASTDTPLGHDDPGPFGDGRLDGRARRHAGGHGIDRRVLETDLQHPGEPLHDAAGECAAPEASTGAEERCTGLPVDRTTVAVRVAERQLHSATLPARIARSDPTPNAVGGGKDTHREPDSQGFAGYQHQAIVGDRKSTRLNSSHVAISYAVFCLKKKKKI